MATHETVDESSGYPEKDQFVVAGPGEKEATFSEEGMELTEKPDTMGATGVGYEKGAKLGDLGEGVHHAENADASDTGYNCLGRFPLKGGFFTRRPKDGQA